MNPSATPGVAYDISTRATKAIAFLQRHANDSTVLNSRWARHVAWFPGGGVDGGSVSASTTTATTNCAKSGGANSTTSGSSSDQSGGGGPSAAYAACWTTAEFLIGLTRTAQLADVASFGGAHADVSLPARDLAKQILHAFLQVLME